MLIVIESIPKTATTLPRDATAYWDSGFAQVDTGRWSESHSLRIGGFFKAGRVTGVAGQQDTGYCVRRTVTWKIVDSRVSTPKRR